MTSVIIILIVLLEVFKSLIDVRKKARGELTPSPAQKQVVMRSFTQPSLQIDHAACLKVTASPARSIFVYHFAISPVLLQLSIISGQRRVVIDRKSVVNCRASHA